MRKLLLAILVTAGFITTASAQVSGNFGLTTDYRFRGISQTQNAPAVQGGLDYAHKSGFYVGNWNSSVTSQVYTHGAGIESDVYAGVKKNLAGFTVDAGVYKYTYPRATGFDTQELYLGASRGALGVKVSETTGNYFGTANSKGTRYYQVDLAQPVGSMTLVAHAGRTEVANHGALNYNDVNVGLTRPFAGMELAARYHVNRSHVKTFGAANTVGGQQLAKDTFVVSLGKSF